MNKKSIILLLAAGLTTGGLFAEHTQVRQSQNIADKDVMPIEGSLPQSDIEKGQMPSPAEATTPNVNKTPVPTPEAEKKNAGKTVKPKSEKGDFIQTE